MVTLYGKRVRVDLEELKRLCEECMQGIEAMEGLEAQAAMREVCSHCMDVQERVSSLLGGGLYPATEELQSDV